MTDTQFSTSILSYSSSGIILGQCIPRGQTSFTGQIRLVAPPLIGQMSYGIEFSNRSNEIGFRIYGPTVHVNISVIELGNVTGISSVAVPAIQETVKKVKKVVATISVSPQTTTEKKSPDFDFVSLISIFILFI
jgi:hypothetical protein